MQIAERIGSRLRLTQITTPPEIGGPALGRGYGGMMDETRKRIVLASDDTLLREGVASLLRGLQLPETEDDHRGARTCEKREAGYSP